MSLTMRLLLLAVALFGVALSVNDFEIEFSKTENCLEANEVAVKPKGNEYVVQNSKYKVIGAKLFWANANGKILGLSACKVPASQRCVSSGETNGNPTFIFLEVTLRFSSFEDQDIHYMYNDADFKLSKLESPKDQSNMIHRLTNYLYPSSVKYKGSRIFSGVNCKTNRVKAFISGHGYFITKVGDRTGSWLNMYYAPDQTGQYVTVPK